MKILYLGDDFEFSTSADRRRALERLGHEVIAINPRRWIPQHRAISGLNVRTGFRLFAPLVGARLQREIQSAGTLTNGIAWIDGCPELPPSLYRGMRAEGLRIINYNVDDPFGRRDRRKWDLYLAAVRHHDLTVVVRRENVDEARRWGSRLVEWVFRSYDPVTHAPSPTAYQPITRDVAFFGTWMPERGPFMVSLLNAGIPLEIWGDHWQKAPEWPVLKLAWKGPAQYGPAYVREIQHARVALGLLSKGNRDLHTTRSLEVPFIGGAVFCAERTSEHLALYREGEEAVFWKDAEECAAACRTLLESPDRCRAMAAAARRRVITHGLSNDEIMAHCLSLLTSSNKHLGQRAPGALGYPTRASGSPVESFP